MRIVLETAQCFLTGGIVTAVFSQEHFLWESDSTTCNETKHMREKGGIYQNMLPRANANTE